MIAGGGGKGRGPSWADIDAVTSQVTKAVTAAIGIGTVSSPKESEVDKLKRENADLARTVDRLQTGAASTADDADMGGLGAPLGSAGRTTAELEGDLKKIDAKIKRFAESLKEDPDDAAFASYVDTLKQQAEAKRLEYHSSKDPEDRLRGNHQRRNRLKNEVEALTTKLRQATVEQEDAQKRADALYEKILQHNSEIERLRVEERTLCSEAKPINNAASMGTIFQELRGNYEARFLDT